VGERLAPVNAAGVSSPVSGARAAVLRLADVVTSRPLVLLGALFAAAFLLRLVEVAGAPLDFHAMRQYRGLIIARDLFFDASPVIPDWQRQVAEASRAHQGTLEPPIMELLVATGYRLLGSEQLWLPRVLSSLIWLLGGGFLYAIVRRIGGGIAALFAAGFYLLLPFAVAASRSFQPDPLMVALTLASLWATLRYQSVPSGGRLAVAAALSGLAVLVLPRTVFVLAAVFAGLALVRGGARRGLVHPHTAIFGLVLLAPALASYGLAAATGGWRADVAQATIVPQLWLSSLYWRGWLEQIDATVGLLPFFGALVGTLLYREATARAFAVGLWIGYAAFCLVFNYAIAVHDYYHLQLVPIVAIGLAPLASLFLGQLGVLDAPARIAAFGVLAMAILLVVAFDRARIANPGWVEQVATKEEIGAVVGHSPRTVFLSGDYGLSLEYHGFVAGEPWPLASDLEWERLAGAPAPAAADRFAEAYAPASPEFFIVEDLDQLALQQDLADLLEGTYPVLVSGGGYVVYDLRAEAGR
jgi:hypothetical protein